MLRRQQSKIIKLFHKFYLQFLPSHQVRLEMIITLGSEVRFGRSVVEMSVRGVLCVISDKKGNLPILQIRIRIFEMAI